MVISGPLDKEKAYRFINTLKMIDWYLPVLTISGDTSIHDFIASNGFGDVTVIPTDYAHVKMKGVISRILKSRSVSNADDNGNGLLIVGNSPEMIRIKRKTNGKSINAVSVAEVKKSRKVSNSCRLLANAPTEGGREDSLMPMTRSYTDAERMISARLPAISRK